LVHALYQQPCNCPRRWPSRDADLIQLRIYSLILLRSHSSPPSRLHGRSVGSDDRVSNIRVATGGTLAGLAICGMHYLGQAGISNYTCIYSAGNVVGSAVVAAAASVVALSVFFILRASWTNSWWKRALCAFILAGAVFGMHWLASVGTQYRLKQGGPSLSHNISRDSTVIVVIVLVRPLQMSQPVLILR
jgi:NO-binding membrane sensor protein with MHYT domain